MTRENKSTIILSLIVCGIAAILGILNKSYLVSGMYIGTVILTNIIMREKDKNFLLLYFSEVIT